MTSDGLSTLPNVFQRLMLQWERFAPYNAGQCMTLAGSLDPHAIGDAWRETVIALGLQQIGQHPDAPVTFSALPLGEGPGVRAPDDAITLSPSHRDISDPRAPSPLTPLPEGEGDRPRLLQTFVTRELNRPFALGDSPLRPFAIVAGDRTHLGLIYRHVVADSASIRLVMRGWFDRLFDRALPGHVSLARGISERRPLWQTIGAALREFPRLSRVKRVRRLPAERADPTQPVAWRRLTLPDGLIDGALRYARSRNVKLNDVFLAAAALACEAHVPCEGADKRRDLGVGTIVDVRPSTRPAQTHFGLSLGFLQTFWRPQDLRDWDRVLMTAARSSHLARTRGEADASLLRLAFAERFGRRLSTVEAADFYRKRCPLAAGISNVNLNIDWPSRHHPSPLIDYTRVSPLGPMLPLVFTPTTLGKTANLGVTYRTSVLDETRANEVIDAFVDHLARLA